MWVHTDSVYGHRGLADPPSGKREPCLYTVGLVVVSPGLGTNPERPAQPTAQAARDIAAAALGIAAMGTLGTGSQFIVAATGALDEVSLWSGKDVYNQT